MLAAEGYRSARLELYDLPPEVDQAGRSGLFANGTLVVDDIGGLTSAEQKTGS